MSMYKVPLYDLPCNLYMIFLRIRRASMNDPAENSIYLPDETRPGEGIVKARRLKHGPTLIKSLERLKNSGLIDYREHPTIPSHWQIWIV